jgi:hypothetical protein
MEMAKRGKIRFLTPTIFDAAGVSVQGFTTRHEGLARPPYNSLNLGLNTRDLPARVEGNRSLLARAVGSEQEHLVTVSQVHGSDLLVIDTPNQDFSHFHHIECDGIVTNQRGVLIGIGVADCYPVLLLDPKKRVAAALHAGWKGSAAGICRKGVATLMEFFGSKPTDILAAIGPGIGPCCYEVDEPVRLAFTAGGNGWEPFTEQTGPERWRLNLAEANRLQLLQSGLQPDHVTLPSHCVSCTPELFFSYRRDSGETGRQMGFIMLTRHD